ncbi:hypothetical protein D3C72_2217850 [compost metagenome]
MDVANKSFILLYDGKPEATMPVPDIEPSRTHFMAVRSIGNEVNFDDIEVTNLD